MDSFYRSIGKRVFDILLSCSAIIIMLPIFFVVSVLIIIFDGSPIIFSQTRVGRGSKPFKIFKFRTMSVKRVATDSEFEPGNDLRVTAVGRVLRKAKLDELPQLLNVLVGDMSIIGPRPEIKKWTEVYPERWSNVLSVKPGISDRASIIYRNEEQLLASSDNPELLYSDGILPLKLDSYEEYINDISLRSDLYIVLLTIKSLFEKQSDSK